MLGLSLYFQFIFKTLKEYQVESVFSAAKAGQAASVKIFEFKNELIKI